MLSHAKHFLTMLRVYNTERQHMRVSRPLNIQQYINMVPNLNYLHAMSNVIFYKKK